VWQRTAGPAFCQASPLDPQRCPLRTGAATCQTGRRRSCLTRQPLICAPRATSTRRTTPGRTPAAAHTQPTARAGARGAHRCQAPVRRQMLDYVTRPCLHAWQVRVRHGGVAQSFGLGLLCQRSHLLSVPNALTASFSAKPAAAAAAAAEISAVQSPTELPTLAATRRRHHRCRKHRPLPILARLPLGLLRAACARHHLALLPGRSPPTAAP